MMDEQSLRLEIIRICHRPGANGEETTHQADKLYNWVTQGKVASKGVTLANPPKK